MKDWAVDNLGTNDKPLLLAGTFTVVALLAALTGIIVICGGVPTANATVYLIDSVMMPPSMS